MENYLDVNMPEKCNKILKYTHAQKSIKMTFVIYKDDKYLLEKLYMNVKNN